MVYKNKRNPILPLDVHVPDGEAHVMPDGKLYIYGSYDTREDVYCSEEYHVVSTPDLEHWTVHDVSFQGKQVPWFNNPDAPKYPGIDWSNPTPFIRKMLEQQVADGVDMKAAFEEAEKGEKPPLLFAPDAICRDGKYYLYFCMPDNSEGVAVSDRPEGPFSQPRQLPCGGIDPAVFEDTDGQVYFYWGQLFSHGVKLNPDLLSFDEKEVVHDLVTEEEHYFHEGSSMRKIGDNYYYIYSDMERGKPTALGYSMGKSPLGPFTYQGIIIDNDGCDPESWNNHGSIEEINGQWYVFYHRCSRGTQQHRRLCIEPITINPDGTINEVKMTSQGIGEPFGPGEVIYGYQACQLSGKIYIGLDGTGSECLTNIAEGDTSVFRYVYSETGFRSVSIEAEGKGIADIYFDEKYAGSVMVEGIGKTQSVLKNSGTEIQTLKLAFREPKGLKLRSVTLG